MSYASRRTCIKSGLLSASLLMSCVLLGCSPQSSQILSEATQSLEKHADADPQIQALIDAALASDVGYSVVESLTTEIGPRLAGSDAEARAREWGVAKLKSLGFENVRIEPFTVPGWERGIETASIQFPSPQKLYITALGGSVATPSGGVTAPVAYFPTFEDLENAPDEGLEGKIVYISGRMEKAPDGAGYGPANRKRRSGASEAAIRGAVAVLIRSVGTDSHRFPHTGQMRYADDVKKIPIAAMSGPDADQMDRLLAGGDTVMTVNMEIGPRFLGELPSGNVIGEIVGSERPEEIIVVGGHLDSWDLGTGAIDDGAGVGITVGAAKVIMESGLKPKRTIRVVMFGAEEIGLLGGSAYAQQHKDELANHITAMESDFGAGPVYEVRPGKTQASKAFAAKLQAQIEHLGVALSETESGGGPDIVAMNAAGVPSVRLQQNGFDYFDLHHTPDDTLDKIDPKELAQNVAAYTAFLAMIANSDVFLRDAAGEAEAEATGDE